MPTFAYNSPVGWLSYELSDGGVLTKLWFAEGQEAPTSPTEVANQLDRYFRGESDAFAVEVEPAGTEFQRAVWSQLVKIPFGETRSYGQIANSLGNPGAVRAVGAANGANPIAIVVPCHRVIGASGALTGFGGGLDRKAWLLEHEAKQARLF